MIKKGFLVIVSIVCFACLTANAQSKFSLGPNAGVGHSWVTNTEKTKFKLAANVGLSLVYSATEHFGVGLDAKYSFEGVKSDENNVALDLNYFRFPVKFVYFFNGYGNPFRPKLFLGPSFGFLSTAKLGNTNQKNAFNSFDFGVTAGAGFNYRMVKNTWFNADINYLHGLSDITKITTSTNRNRNLQLNVGVNFGL